MDKHNDKYDIFENLRKEIEFDLKPNETEISTMTLCLKIDDSIMEKKVVNKKEDSLLFNCFNIYNYLKVDNNIIDDIVFCDENGEIQNRNILKRKKKQKKKKKVTTKKIRKDSFYNQITVVVKVSDIKTINIKLFQNGSIQMTGCDSIDNARKSIKILFELLNRPRYIIDFKKKEVREVKFLHLNNNTKNLVIKNIISGIVVLINCNFNIGFEINRDKLYEIISQKKSDSILEIKKHDIHENIDKDIPQKYMDCTYDPIRHACVNIKLNHPTMKTITIFVFESGSIIILGRSCRQIRDAYNFINVFLLTNYFNIASKNN